MASPAPFVQGSRFPQNMQAEAQVSTKRRLPRVLASEPVKWAVLAGGCALGTALLLLRDPALPGGYIPPCPVFALTGLYCPGCGTARALHSLLHADLPAALGYNPLLVVALPFIAAVLGAYALQWTRGTSLPSFVTSRAVGLAALWLVATYAVLRNIPLEPFTHLAP
jgi:hypothetical protein